MVTPVSPVDQSFAFADALAQRFGDADAITHYHMNPAAHDDQAVSRLSSLFDAVAEHDGQE